jgi:hypothetical protein
MKNTKRALLALSLALVGVATASVGASVLNAKAEGEVEAITEQYFRMVDGASIRQITAQAEGVDQNGIRFGTELSKAFYDAIQKKEGESVKFYTLVSNTATSVEALVYSADEKKVDWGTIYFDEAGAYVRYTELMNFPQNLYATTFTARSCYVLDNATPEDATDDVVVYATGTESRRSMEGVAVAHLTENPTETAGFGQYLGLSADGAIEKDEKAGVFGANRTDKGVAIVGGENFGATARVYQGSKLVEDATVANGKVTVSKVENTEYTIVDAGKAIQKYIRGCDYLIGTKAEFIAWATAQSKVKSSDKNSAGNGTTTNTVINAVLDAHIDLTGEKFTHDIAGTNTGFGNGVLRGSFDGQGYTVNGLEHDRKSLFYNVSSTGGYTIKNVAFTNVVLSRANGSVRYFFAGTASGKTTLENVYLQVVSAPNSIATTEIGITNDCGMLAVKNCVFDFAFTYAEGALAYTKAPIFRNRTPQYGVENCIAITKTTLLATGNALTAVEGYTYANYGVYESTAKVAEAVTANTISLSGFSGSYWTTSAGYPVWKN